MKITKETRGITLIALIIIIIVLLIIAGVAVSQIANNNILNNAQTAVDKYNEKTAEEETIIGQLEGLLDQYAGGNQGGGSTPEPTQTLLSTVVSVGDYITYDPELGVTKDSMLNYTSPEGTLKVKKTQNGNEYAIVETGKGWSSSVGSYSYSGAYDLLNEEGEFEIPENSTYYIENDVAGNGYDSQSFTSIGASTVWRVLDITEGTIKIVPDTAIKSTSNTDFKLRGLRGYKNAVTELNKICEIFGHGQGACGAESIKIEDVNKLTGYQYTKPESTTYVASPLSRSWYDTSCDYSLSELNEQSSDSSWLFGCGPWWCASPCVYLHPTSYNYSDYASFGVITVWSNSAVGHTEVYTVWDDKGEYIAGDQWSAHGVLPVVSLRSDVVKTGGTGAQGSPWTFQVTELTERIGDNEVKYYDGTNQIGQQWKTNGTALTLTSTTPTKEGKVFICWSTNNDGTGTCYANGESYETDADLTLYAVWAEDVASQPFAVAGATVIESDLSKGYMIQDSNGNYWTWVQVPRAQTYDQLVAYIKGVDSDLRTGSSSDISYSRNPLGNNYNTQLSSVISRIENNGGFYIGSYEVGFGGTTEGRSNDSTTWTSQEAKIQPDMIPYNYVSVWEAETLAEGLNPDVSYNCTLMFGIQWDLTLAYLKSSGSVRSLADSRDWGNHGDSNEYHIKMDHAGAMYTDEGRNNYTVTYNSGFSEGVETTENGNWLLTTGASVSTRKKNISDLAGNIAEWTLEKNWNDSYPITARGGSYFWQGYSGGSATKRYGWSNSVYASTKDHETRFPTNHILS